MHKQTLVYGQLSARSIDSSTPPRAGRRSAQRTAVLALVVGTVLARANRLPPPRVVAIPRDRLLQALSEAHARRPAEGAHLLGGQRVAAVVPGAVADVLDLGLPRAGQLDDAPHDRHVRLLVGAAGVVDLALHAMLEHVADRGGEVGGVDPVAHLHAVA